MSKVIYFDVDDTLYNQIEPFSKAFEKILGVLILILKKCLKQVGNLAMQYSKNPKAEYFQWMRCKYTGLKRL